MGYLDNELARIESAIDGEDMRDAIVAMVNKVEQLLSEYPTTEIYLSNGKFFNISVPNGESDPLTYHFTVDSNGNTTIT